MKKFLEQGRSAICHSHESRNPAGAQAKDGPSLDAQPPEARGYDGLFGPSVSAMLLCAMIVCSAFVSPRAFAQSRQIPAPPQSHPIVLTGAVIHTVSGETYESGYIVFDKGVITHVGAGVPPAIEGATSIELNGLHIYPGLINAHSTLGLVETGAVDITNDHTEFGRMRPEVRAAVAINPDSDHIPVARAAGLTNALVCPKGGVIAGRCTVARLDGWTWERIAMQGEAGLVINWPRYRPIDAWWMDESVEEQRKNNAEALVQIEAYFDQAEEYLRATPIVEGAPSGDDIDMRFEAMRAALSGEQPVYIRADSVQQIEAAVAFANRRGMRPIIIGGRDADRATTLLLKHKVPVIVDGTHHLPRRRHEDYDAPFRLPNRLHKAGVTFCIAAGTGSAHERNLPHNAATAAAYGLDKDIAIKAITLYAAQTIGLGDTHGSLDVGKSATLIVTTGDPLEMTTEVMMSFIDGRQIDLGSRHKSQFNKYRRKYEDLGILKKKSLEVTQ